jgi:hypothetical protein
MRTRISTLVALALFAAVPAAGTIVAQGSAPFADNNGFFLGTKSFTVYTAEDPGNPAPGPAGSLTYVYTISNDPSSFVGLIGFNLEVAEGSVAAGDIGWIDTAGNPTPVAATLDATSAAPGFDTVRFDWASADQVAPGTVGDQLYVISSFSPGGVSDNIYSVEGDFASQETSFCIGPLTPPAVVGEPLPCTIGFWKNRADGKMGTLQHFADGDFEAVVAEALTLSSGLFTSADPGANCGTAGFDDLLCALGSQGKRTIEERGRQQLAATFLNLAAGDLFPDNTECKVFEGNGITTNACGDGLSVGEAVNQSRVGIGGDEAAQHEAHECSDDLNNGIGVVQ